MMKQKGSTAQTPQTTFRNSIYFYTGLLISLYIGFYLLNGLYSLSLVIMLLSSGYLVSYKLSAAKKEKAATFSIITVLAAQVYVLDYTFGWQFGAHYFLLATIPLISTGIRLKKAEAVVFSVAVAVCYFSLMLLLYNRTPVHEIDGFAGRLLGELNILASFGAVAAVLGRYNNFLLNSEKKLKSAHGDMLKLANTDALTGIANRRYIQEALDKALAEASAEACSLGVAIADLDDFKAINDRYGHECGDAVLKEVCNRFQSIIRKTDLLGRWGGEEFLFILKDTDLFEAAETMERLRLSITETPFKWKHHLIELSITAGVSVYHPEIAPDRIVAKADDLLYSGKKAGKNRVVYDQDLAECYG